MLWAQYPTCVVGQRNLLRPSSIIRIGKKYLDRFQPSLSVSWGTLGDSPLGNISAPGEKDGLTQVFNKYAFSMELKHTELD